MATVEITKERLEHIENAHRVLGEFHYEPPQVEKQGEGLAVRVVVQPEGEEVTLSAGRVVLSAGIEAEPGNESLSQLLKLPLTAEGFFLEAHVKLRPVDFAADGVYLCGLAHSPRGIDETIAQAQAAAVRAVSLLAKKELTATPIIASVNPRLCRSERTYPAKSRLSCRSTAVRSAKEMLGTWRNGYCLTA